MNNCVIYTRVSSEKQIDGYSLDSQADLCRKKAEQLGYAVARVFREEGISGTTTHRVQLQEMLAYVKEAKHEVAAIIVYSYSRLNRNTIDYLTIRALLAKHGILLISVTEPGSGDSPAEKMIGTILSSFAQFENESRAQNVANSLRKRFLEGHITSAPPLGYVMQKVNGKSVAVKDPVWFPIVKAMWSRIDVEHLSCRQIAQSLNKLGLVSPTKKHCRKFLPQTVHKVFTNKFYAGILVSLKYGEAPGQHEPMIDMDTFYRVRDVLTGKRSNQHEHYQPAREDFPLKGVLRCDCGRKLTAAWSKGKSKSYAYYSCAIRGEHKIVSHPKDDVKIAFNQLMDRLTMTSKFMKWFGEIVIEKYKLYIESLEMLRQPVNNDIKKLTTMLERIDLKHAEGIYTDEGYLKLKDTLEEQLAIKRGAISELKIDELEATRIMNFIEFYFSHLRLAWTRASLEGKLAIGCSIFPAGLVFEGEKFRTPQLGRGYALTQEYSTRGVNFGESAGIRT